MTLMSGSAIKKGNEVIGNYTLEYCEREQKINSYWSSVESDSTAFPAVLSPCRAEIDTLFYVALYWFSSCYSFLVAAFEILKLIFWNAQEYLEIQGDKGI